MVDEFGVMVPGTHALDFPTEERALKAFNAAAGRAEVQTIKVVRDYILVE